MRANPEKVAIATLLACIDLKKTDRPIGTDCKGEGGKRMGFKIVRDNLFRIGYDFYADTAERIVKYRNDAGLTQEALAKKADVKLTTISRYESVSIRFRLPVLEQISKALNVTLDALIGADFGDPDCEDCLYVVYTEKDLNKEECFGLYFKGRSPQEAFLKAYEWSFEVGVRWFECRDRAIVILKGVPVKKADYAHLKRRGSKEEEDGLPQF